MRFFSSGVMARSQSALGTRPNIEPPSSQNRPASRAVSFMRQSPPETLRRLLLEIPQRELPALALLIVRRQSVEGFLELLEHVLQRHVELLGLGIETLLVFGDLGLAFRG